MDFDDLPPFKGAATLFQKAKQTVGLKKKIKKANKHPLYKAFLLGFAFQKPKRKASTCDNIVAEGLKQTSFQS